MDYVVEFVIREVMRFVEIIRICMLVQTMRGIYNTKE